MLVLAEVVTSLMHGSAGGVKVERPQVLMERTRTNDLEAG